MRTITCLSSIRNLARSTHSPRTQISGCGFSLVEVVLAIGVLSLAIVALLGLFGPTMGSVKQVVDTNTATAVVSRINTHIHQEMSWGDVASAVPAGGTIRYVWRRQHTLDSPVEFVVSGGNSSGTDLTAPVNVGTSDTATLTADLANGRLVGTPMAVTFERSTVNDYDYGDVANQGYIPILVSIYPIEPNLAGTTDFNSVTKIKQRIDPIFTYTAAKTRSM